MCLLSVSRTKENGFERDGTLHPDVHPSKRPCTISPAQRFSPSNGLSYQPNGLPHPGPLPPQHYRLDDMAIAHHYRDSYRHPTSNHREIRERARPLGESKHPHTFDFEACFYGWIFLLFPSKQTSLLSVFKKPATPAGGNTRHTQHKNKDVVSFIEVDYNYIHLAASPEQQVDVMFCETYKCTT